MVTATLLIVVTLLTSYASSSASYCAYDITVTARQQLRDLFSTHPEFPPVSSMKSTPQQLLFLTRYRGVVRVRPESNELTLVAKRTLFYSLPILAWKETTNCTLKKIYLLPEKIKDIPLWVPLAKWHVFVQPLGYPFIKINSDGGFHYVYGYEIVHVSCQLDMDFYPYDIQLCHYVVKYDGFVGQLSSSAECKNLADTEAPNPVWENVACVSEVLDGTDVITDILLVRKSRTFMVTTVLPVVILNFLTPIIFLTPAGSTAKIGVGMSLLLSIVMNMSGIYRQLPPGRLPYFYVYLLTGLVLNSVAVVIGGIIQQTTPNYPKRAIIWNNVAFIVTSAATSISFLVFISILSSAPGVICEGDFCNWQHLNYTQASLN